MGNGPGAGPVQAPNGHECCTHVFSLRRAVSHESQRRALRPRGVRLPDQLLSDCPGPCPPPTWCAHPRSDLCLGALPLLRVKAQLCALSDSRLLPLHLWVLPATGVPAGLSSHLCTLLPGDTQQSTTPSHRYICFLSLRLTFKPCVLSSLCCPEGSSVHTCFLRVVSGARGRRTVRTRPSDHTVLGLSENEFSHHRPVTITTGTFLPRHSPQASPQPSYLPVPKGHHSWLRPQLAEAGTDVDHAPGLRPP